jgi:hypothetical protein
VARPSQFSADSWQNFIPVNSWVVCSSPLLRLPSPPTVCCSLVRHQTGILERDKNAPASPSETSASVTLLAFAEFLTALCARLVVSPIVKRAAYGRVTDSGFKKKAMKTTYQIEASAPANVRPSSVSKHQVNRGLSTEAVLNYLRTKLPQQYNLAEVVGKWIWLDVSPERKPGMAKMLWALGFHWNQRRGVWQHPCGSFNPFGIHPADPRAKYRSYFPADTSLA